MKELETDEELKEVVKEHKVVIVDFFTTWCGPCKILSPRLEEIEGEMEAKDVGFCKADCDKLKATSDAFDIENVPTVVIYVNGDPDKNVIVGCEKKDFYVERIDKILEDINGYAEKMEIFQLKPPKPPKATKPRKKKK